MIKLLIITDNNYNVKNNNSIQPKCGVGILDEVSPKWSFNLLAIGVECRLLFINFLKKLSFCLAILWRRRRRNSNSAWLNPGFLLFDHGWNIWPQTKASARACYTTTRDPTCCPHPSGMWLLSSQPLRFQSGRFDVVFCGSTGSRGCAFGSPDARKFDVADDPFVKDPGAQVPGSMRRWKILLVCPTPFPPQNK
jgi:hypothetical protein